MSIARVTNPSLPCHYEMVRSIRAKLMEWSPAIFVGYNSMNFDEHLLRQALFRTLHEPYLTNTGGNCRADVLPLVQAASQVSPGCASIPVNTQGRPVFKLDQLAPLNGFSHPNAHDALADVEATIHMARCVKDRAPACWDRFVELSSKAGVTSFLDREGAFVLTELYFNRPYHFVVTPIGADPENPAAQLCLDLRHNLDQVAALDDEALGRWLCASPKPVRKVKTNAAPSLAPVGEVPSAFLGQLTLQQVHDRVVRIRSDQALRRRLVSATVTGREEYEVSPHVEEQIYAGFIPNADKRRMDAFHARPWQSRAAIVSSLQDARLRYHGYRLIYERHPELLDPQQRSFYRDLDRSRLADGSAKPKWNSFMIARAALKEIRANCTEQQATILAEYEQYIVDRMALR